MNAECHAHVIMDGKNYKQAVSLHEQGVQKTIVRDCLLTYQKRGITFLRDGGDSRQVSAYAKEIAEEYGIDYRSPLFAIHKKDHYGGIVGKSFSDWKEFRDLVLTVKAQGGDFIKIMISGLLDFEKHYSLNQEGLAPEEIREMVDIAHSEGFAVMVHGNGNVQVAAAVEAGVESVEHGYFLQEETFHMMREKGTVWVPTFSPVGNMIGCGRFQDVILKELLEQQMEHVRRAVELGVCTAPGSDAGAYMVPHGEGLDTELSYYREIFPDEDFLEAKLSEGVEKIKRAFVRP